MARRGLPNAYIDVRFLQQKKAERPISVTLSGISTDLRLVQFLKAFSPIFNTVLGISIEERLEQLINA